MSAASQARHHVDDHHDHHDVYGRALMCGNSFFSRKKQKTEELDSISFETEEHRKKSLFYAVSGVRLSSFRDNTMGSEDGANNQIL